MEARVSEWASIWEKGRKRNKQFCVFFFLHRNIYFTFATHKLKSESLSREWFFHWSNLRFVILMSSGCLAGLIIGEIKISSQHRERMNIIERKQKKINDTRCLMIAFGNWASISGLMPSFRHDCRINYVTFLISTSIGLLIMLRRLSLNLSDGTRTERAVKRRKQVRQTFVIDFTISRKWLDWAGTLNLGFCIIIVSCFSIWS